MIKGDDRNMPADIQERIALAASMATMAAEIKNFGTAQSVLVGKVEAGNAQSSQQNGEIMAKIAVLTNEQKNNSKYQDECDAERKTMRQDIGAIKTKSALISLGFSWVVPAIIEAVMVAHK